LNTGEADAAPAACDGDPLGVLWCTRNPSPSPHARLATANRRFFPTNGLRSPVLRARRLAMTNQAARSHAATPALRSSLELPGASTEGIRAAWPIPTAGAVPARAGVRVG